jgi:hypothetical protein
LSFALLNQETVQVLEQVDVKQKFLNGGMEVVASSAQQLAVATKPK